MQRTASWPGANDSIKGQIDCRRLVFATKLTLAAMRCSILSGSFVVAKPVLRASRATRQRRYFCTDRNRHVRDRTCLYRCDGPREDSVGVHCLSLDELHVQCDRHVLSYQYSTGLKS
jgi:hypothetical protein